MRAYWALPPAADTEPAESGERLGRGVALADAADVQRHLRRIEHDRASCGVEVQLAIAAVRRRGSDGSGVWHAPGRARGAPQLDQRSLRDVECAAGFAGEGLRGREHGE